jgi:uncharacterized membrane protein
MGKGRLEAFTDGVVAVIITIMVLEIKPPAGATLAALKASSPALLGYALSFVNVAIFWNNHHHMLHATERVSGAVLWANMLLLFSISLIPFAIAWMDNTSFATVPTASYGVVLLMAAISYALLEAAIIRANGPSSTLARAVGRDVKGWCSTFAYVAAIPLSFVRVGIALALYVIVAMIWFIPDRRIESVL